MSTATLLALGAGSVVTCGDVPTGGLATVCVEGWFRVTAISSVNRPLTLKYGGDGHEWALYVTSDGRVYFVVFDADGEVNAGYTLPWAVQRGRLQHLLGLYDGTVCEVWVDGVAATFASVVHGAVVADTTQAVQFGGYIGEAATGFVGQVSWQRISQVSRAGAALRGPGQPPAVDGDTLALWYMSEGSGSTVDNAEGTADYDGTVTAGVWATAAVSQRERSQRPVGAAWGRRWAGAVGGGVLHG